MPLVQVGASVVVVAHQFNPSVVSEVWLTRNDLLRVEDRREGCIFTDAFVNVQTTNYNLLVTPDQLQFAPVVEPEAQQELLLARVGSIVDLLPHVPYHAAGLNFIWVFDPAPESISDASRRLFFTQDRPFFRQFDTPDAQFGAYLSKGILDCRLKLDIKPIIPGGLPPGVVAAPAIHLGFNFHLDVFGDENPPSRIRGLLGKWDEAKREAERIAHDVEKYL